MGRTASTMTSCMARAGSISPLKVRSMVGLIPLFASAILESDLIEQLPSFQRRTQWFINNWEDIDEHLERGEEPGHPVHQLLALVNSQKLPRLLSVMLDEGEFLSPYGLRSLSRYHLEHPFPCEMAGGTHTGGHGPAQSAPGPFGGESHWRGPPR